MKKITGHEDFKTPIILLFLFSIRLVYEEHEIVNNIKDCGSIMLSEPILFTGNILETLIRFCWFAIPIVIFFTAIKEKDLFLKFIYMIGSVSLFLTTPLINKLGFKSLYVIRILMMFVVVICVVKYLINTTELYKINFKKKNK